MSERHTDPDGLRASRQVVRRSAQALADAIDRALWAFQNVPEAGTLRRCLVGCKAELDRALESSGYALEVRDGFATKVRKRRSLALAASAASAAARVAGACGERAPALSAVRRAEPPRHARDTVRRFIEQRPDYERLCAEVARILRKKIGEAQIEVSSIPHRAKTLASFLKKLDRKDYVDPFNEITDFAGVRVVYLYPGDLEAIEEIIVREFEVVERVDKQGELGVSEFGYSAVHFIVRLGSAFSGTGHGDLKQLVCEIQVRTVLQDAWGIIQHHLVYKQESQVPGRFHRKLNSLAGLFEVADDQFELLRAIRRESADAIGAKLAFAAARVTRACGRCRDGSRGCAHAIAAVPTIGAGLRQHTARISTKKVVEGGYYKVTPEAKSGKTGLIPQQLRILGRMLKNNGEDKVYVVSVDGDHAQVAGWPGDAIVGTLRVKVSDLVVQ